jgi:hypothetical protein
VATAHPIDNSADRLGNMLPIIGSFRGIFADSAVRRGNWVRVSRRILDIRRRKY